MTGSKQTQHTDCKGNLLARMREGHTLDRKEEIELIAQLAFPAIIAQLSSIIMQYIDASMVGQLGATDSAAIGLVASTTWLIGGLCTAAGIGFNVLIAHRIGAENDKEARNIVRIGLIFALCISLIVMAFCVAFSGKIPLWLGGDSRVAPRASAYFGIYSMALPAMQMMYIAGGMVEASGNMKLPSFLGVLECVLDVIFNLIFIFPSRNISIFGKNIHVYGFGLTIKGAALGTALAEAVAAALCLIYLLRISPVLHLRSGERIHDVKNIIKKALEISVPSAVESVIMGGAQVVSTTIVAPLGADSIAANSFAVTAESLCYMPGYGIQSAAVTLIGQCYGARRHELTRRLGWITTISGIVVMTGAGILMYIFAPEMIGILSPDPVIRKLGTQVLRIEAFAEPMFGASIVASGVFRGTGDTLSATIRNIISMWGVRIPLAAVLSGRLGLRGVWISMCTELIVRGILFLTHLAGNKWEKIRN